MNKPPLESELACPQCGHIEHCGPAQMLERLQEQGMLKRAKTPDPELLLELFASTLTRLGCRQCDQVGLRLQDVNEQDWETGRSCESCGKRIPPERLEVLPDTMRCAPCAAVAVDESPDEYCPKCGSVMSIRPSRGRGLTRYEMSCPDCR